MFRKITTFLLSLLFLSSLVGCSQRLDENYLFSHPETLHNYYLTCQQGKETPETCQIINKTYQRFITLVRKLMASPEVFGKKILELQIKAAKLKNNSKETQAYLNAQREAKLRLILMTKAEGF